MKIRALVLVFIAASLSVSGVWLLSLGSRLASRVVPLEPSGVLWLKPGSVVEPEGLRVTWGVYTPPEEAPKFWRIALIFKANGSIWVRAFWDKPSNPMFRGYGDSLSRVFDVRVVDPTVHNRWTWYLENPNPYTVEVSNFTVKYLGIDKPDYVRGGLTMVLGGVILAVQLPLIALISLSERRK
ncbi:MAG: hypothetical protein QW638_07560 [Candidatus Bathyarchaeia archaeon]|nr:hypothetical protein [Candidatus Bathyarchaeota archaeon]